MSGCAADVELLASVARDFVDGVFVSTTLCVRQGSWFVYIPVCLSWWIAHFLECKLYGSVGRRCFTSMIDVHSLMMP